MDKCENGEPSLHQPRMSQGHGHPHLIHPSHAIATGHVQHTSNGAPPPYQVTDTHAAPVVQHTHTVTPVASSSASVSPMQSSSTPHIAMTQWPMGWQEKFDELGEKRKPLAQLQLLTDHLDIWDHRKGLDVELKPCVISLKYDDSLSHKDDKYFAEHGSSYLLWSLSVLYSNERHAGIARTPALRRYLQAKLDQRHCDFTLYNPLLIQIDFGSTSTPYVKAFSAVQRLMDCKWIQFMRFTFFNLRSIQIHHPACLHLYWTNQQYFFQFCRELHKISEGQRAQWASITTVAVKSRFTKLEMTWPLVTFTDTAIVDLRPLVHLQSLILDLKYVSFRPELYLPNGVKSIFMASYFDPCGFRFQIPSALQIFRSWGSLRGWANDQPFPADIKTIAIHQMLTTASAPPLQRYTALTDLLLNADDLEAGRLQTCTSPHLRVLRFERLVYANSHQFMHRTAIHAGLYQLTYPVQRQITVLEFINSTIAYDDISWHTFFPRLQQMLVSHTRLMDLPPLAEMSNLIRFEVNNAVFSASKLNLSRLPSCLRVLWLRRTNIRELDLSTFQHLTDLNVSNSALLKPLQLLLPPSLRILAIDSCGWQWLPNTLCLGTLQRLYAMGNPLKDISTANRIDVHKLRASYAEYKATSMASQIRTNNE